MRVRRLPQDRARTILGDRAAQRLRHRIGFARLGHDAQDAPRRQQRRDRQGDGVRRRFVERAEVPLAHLLAPRTFVQRDGLDPDRVVEIGEGRIVERQVAVLADAAGAEVGRVGAQQRLILAAGGLGVASHAGHGEELLDLDIIQQMPAQEGREAGGMAGRQVDIFVHVEDIDRLPRHAGQGAQRGQEGELRVAGGDDDVGDAARRDRGPDDLRRLVSGRRAQRLVGGVDAHRELVDLGCVQGLG